MGFTCRDGDGEDKLVLLLGLDGDDRRIFSVAEANDKYTDGTVQRLKIAYSFGHQFQIRLSAKPEHWLTRPADDRECLLMVGENIYFRGGSDIRNGKLPFVNAETGQIKDMIEPPSGPYVRSWEIVTIRACAADDSGIRRPLRSRARPLRGQPASRRPTASSPPPTASGLFFSLRLVRAASGVPQFASERKTSMAHFYRFFRCAINLRIVIGQPLN